MKKVLISPMAWGNGAFVVHKTIEMRLKDYRVMPYNPYITLFPPLLFLFGNRLKKPFAIHTTPDYAAFFRQKNTPLIITFHNYVLDKWMRANSTYLQRIHYATDLKLWTKLGVNYADEITAVSKFIGKLVKKDLNISSPIKVIYNGVDEKKFSPVDRKRDGKPKIKIFFSGNLTYRKGAHWLPAIASKLKKSEIHYTQGLRNKKKLHPQKNLCPIGSVPLKEMPNRYREMDILLMPTVREGFSLSVLEAMACGLPVVASNCSSLPEQIDHGKGGFLCPVGDARAFCEKLNLLAESPNLRKEMGEYNRAKVEKMFTLDQMLDTYKKIFEAVLEKK